MSDHERLVLADQLAVNYPFSVQQVYWVLVLASDDEVTARAALDMAAARNGDPVRIAAAVTDRRVQNEMPRAISRRHN
jgi:hypothetical protein